MAKPLQTDELGTPDVPLESHRLTSRHRIVTTCAHREPDKDQREDFGTQTGPFGSAAKYRELYLPYQKRVNGWIHRHTKWKTLMHCCGGIAPLLEAVLEAEFDILNPVQCSANGMDATALKKQYGTVWCFGAAASIPRKRCPSAPRKRCATRCASASTSSPRVAGLSSAPFTMCRPARPSRTRWRCSKR